MHAIHSCRGLYARPEFANAVSWSEDNLLAAASGPSVVILNPADLAGPRSLITPTVQQFPHPLGDVAPDNRHSNIHSLLRGLPTTQASAKGVGGDLAVRCVSWSPLGCSSSAGCILAVIAEDNKVRVYAPNRQERGEWLVAANLSLKLPAQVDAGNAASSHQEGAMRLRGGAPDTNSHSFAVGDNVEVMNEEEGLNGCWFTGILKKQTGSHVLVCYDELMSEDCPEEHLHEWFSYVKAAKPLAKRVAAPYKINTGRGYQLRPKPSSQDARQQQEWEVGHLVDVWDDGGWWETQIKGPGDQQGQYMLAGVLQTDVGHDRLRASVLWDGSSFKPAVLQQNAAKQGPTQKKRQAEGQQATTQPSSKRQRASADPEADSGVMAEADEDASVDEQSFDPAEETEDDERVQDLVVGGRRGGAGRGGGRGRGRGRPKGSLKKVKAEETYEVPSDFDASVLPVVELSSKATAAKTLPLAFFRRWTQLRNQVPEKDREVYVKGQHLRGVDAGYAEQTRAELMAAHGDRMAELKLDDRWLVKEGKVAIRKGEIKTGSAAAKHVVRARAEHAPSHAVPADFDSGLIGSIDASSAEAALASLSQAIAQRWAVLHEGVAEDAREAYTSGKQGLRGQDVQHLEQAAAEAVHVHREALATYTPDMRAITKQAAHVIKQQLGVLASKKPAEEAAPASVHKPMPVEVPADFDAAELLPGMDCTTLKAAEDTAPLVFLYRWLELHGQIPEDERERYEKGQHLRGADAQLAEQVRAEMMSAFEEELAALSLDSKWLVKNGKMAVRHQALRSNNRAPLQSIPHLHKMPLQMRERLLEQLQAQFPAGEEETEGVPDIISMALSAVAEERRLREARQAEQPARPDADYLKDDESASGKLLSLTAAPAAKKPRKSVHHDKRLAMVADAQLIPAHEWEARLFALSALCVAWSPMCAVATGSQAGARFAVLAAGMKDGSVCLWHYTPPDLTPAPAVQASDESFQPLGRVQAQPSWVTCLAWTSVTADSASHSSPEHMLLASGCCDGSVRLLSIAVSSLSQQSSSGEALPAVHCGTVQPPDLLNVHCLAAGWLAEASGQGRRLVVACGKNMGSLLVWQSTGISSQADLQLAVAQGEAHSFAQAHGTLPVSSVSLASSAARPGTLQLLSTGMNGVIRLWDCSVEQVKAAGNPMAVAIAPDGMPVYGAAASGNGLMVAAVYGRMHQRDLHAPWHNMGKAVLHLQPFSNSCTDLQSAAVATAAALLRPSLPHSPSRTPLHPWQVWDLAALLHIVAQAGAKAAEDEEPAAIQGAAAKDPVAVLEGDLQEPFGGTHLNLQATDRLAACHNPTVLRVLQQCEQPFLQLPLPAHWVADGLAHTQWHRGLRLATALRHWLHPHLTVSRVHEGQTPINQQEEEEPATPPAVIAWTQTLYSNELALLQQRVFACLQPSGVDTAAGMCLPGVGELAQLLMADLTIKHPEIAAPCPGLRQAAADLLAANGSGDLHAGGLPQREHVDWAGAAVGLTGADPLQSAREASLGSQEKPMRLPRCGATLRLCYEAHSNWRCLLCHRHFAADSVGSGQTPMCLFCGMRLATGSLHPRMLTSPGIA